MQPLLYEVLFYLCYKAIQYLWFCYKATYCLVSTRHLIPAISVNFIHSHSSIVAHSKHPISVNFTFTFQFSCTLSKHPISVTLTQSHSSFLAHRQASQHTFNQIPLHLQTEIAFIFKFSDNTCNFITRHNKVCISSQPTTLPSYFKTITARRRKKTVPNTNPNT